MASSTKIELDITAFNTRLRRVLDSWSNGSEEYAAIADVDALLLIAGDPAPSSAPIRQGTWFQMWLLKYEFPSIIMLFQKDRLSILCSSTKAKILAQISESNPTVPVDLFVRERGNLRDTANDPSTWKFLERYLSCERVGALTKEIHTGEVVAGWERKVSAAEYEPELVEMGTAVSAFMA